MSAIADLITAAATRNGVDPATMIGIGRIESGLNPNARNPSSSAGGLFQFIDKTARGYGLTNRFDPAAASDAAARLTRDNAAFLSRRLGRQPTPGELYLAHQQGAGGAAKLLSQPGAPAAQLVGAEAVRLNGGRADMSAGDFAGLWSSKLAKAMGSPLPAGAPVAQGQAPQAGSTLAEALPGATLPTFAPSPIAAVIAPAAPTQAAIEPLRRQQAEAENQARRRALLSIASAF